MLNLTRNIFKFKPRPLIAFQNGVHAFKPSTKITINENYTNLVRKVISSKEPNWNQLRNELLNSERNLTETNIDSIILGFCVADVRLSAGKSYVEFLKSANIEPNLATLGKLLKLYSVAAINGDGNHEMDLLKLSDDLLTKYEILDSTTLDNIIHALTQTHQWRRALKCLDDIKITATASASAYSAIISRAFSSDEIDIGFNLLAEMIENGRKPRCHVLIAWITRCLNSPDSAEGLAQIEKMLRFIGDNGIQISEEVAHKFKEFFEKQGIKCKYSRVLKRGICSTCNSHLQNIQVTNKEFRELSDKFLQKVLLRDNIFLKSNPEEVDKFEKFIARSTQYDIVIDGLNVAYSTGTGKPSIIYAKLVKSVVEYFAKKNKHMLVLGRRHMNGWPKPEMEFIRKHASLFLTENLSQDDPFLLYAAIKSGPKTDFFSRDLMRSHSFLLGNDLKGIFRRWQQEHQYSLISATDFRKIIIKEPVRFKTSAHKINSTWHIPFITEEFNPNQSETFDIPKSWLCVPLQIEN